MDKIARNLLLIASFWLLSPTGLVLTAQDGDINRLVSTLLADSPIEEDLRELCDEIGGRVTGSDANAEAVDWGLRKFRDSGVAVRKHAFEMPALWLPGATSVKVIGDVPFIPLVVSKYASPPGTYQGQLFDAGMGTEADFERLGSDVAGHFILVETDLCRDINGLFSEYAAASHVEDLARKAGVQGIVFISSRPKKVLYRYVTKHVFGNELPQLVMAREDAKRCQRLLRNGNTLSLEVTINAQTGTSYTAQNVIAEIPGTDNPEEVVIIGAHLDSWALGTGANDNGCNVAMMIDIARQMQQLGIRPKRTIRFALWNGEEQGFFGSHAYVRDERAALDKHVMAMSVDIGSGGIIGFFMNGNEQLEPLLDEMLKPVSAFGPYLQIPNAIVGTDNFDFLLEGVANLVANQKPYNYGLNYHASSDTYDKVDLQALKQNAAIVAAVTPGFANGGGEVVLPRVSRSEIEHIMEAYQMEFSMRMFNVWEGWAAGERGRSE